MDNIALKLIDEELESIEFEQAGNDGFVIDNDEKAEWALAKIREERAEAQRIINVCQTMIEKYEMKIKEVQDKLPQKTAYLEKKLMEYFQTVPKKKTKTMEKYVLPSGVLKKKYPKPEFKRDDETLLKWIKKHEINSHLYIKVKESPDWARFKAVITLAGDKVVTQDGEIVEGVTVVERPPEFIVEV